MDEYKALYLKLFNAVTDAEKMLRQADTLTQQAGMMLRSTQRECEELFSAMDEKEVSRCARRD